MVEKQEASIIELKILELEDKLMNIIEMANNYPDVPVPIFEQDMEEIISKIESLQRVNKCKLFEAMDFSLTSSMNENYKNKKEFYHKNNSLITSLTFLKIDVLGENCS